jgi:hypothetical protein
VGKMTDEQREFWRALTAPFPRDAYKVRDGRGGKRFTYLESRTIENRLDDVVGPDGWDLEQFETSRGIISRLILEVPDGRGGLKKVSRTGGGGFRTLQDDDSSYKSGFTSSFRSAAARFGIGRDLYNQGMPGYCADLHDGRASGTPTSGHGSGPPAPGGRPNGNGNGTANADSLKPPWDKPGRAPYAWAMKVGEHFGNLDVVGRMIAYAEKRRKPKRTDQWDEAFLNECLAKTIEWLKEHPNYNGEFGPREPQPARSEPAPSQARNGEPHPLVGPIAAAANALIHKQTGREATPGEIVSCIQDLASSVPNGSGQRGEVMRSLRGCIDAAWLKNILDAANQRIKEAAQLAAADASPDDDIPF